MSDDRKTVRFIIGGAEYIWRSSFDTIYETVVITIATEFYQQLEFTTALPTRLQKNDRQSQLPPEQSAPKATFWIRGWL